MSRAAVLAYAVDDELPLVCLETMLLANGVLELAQVRADELDDLSATYAIQVLVGWVAVAVLVGSPPAES